MSCLLIGEGNFSNSVKLSETTSDFVATCLESVNPHCEETKSNIELLRKKGIEVLVDVDARKLNNLHPFIEKNGRFRRIIFNFPHVGGKMKISNNRQLLKEFFNACLGVLELENGLIDVALCKGQGGTPVDGKRLYSNTWKISEIAATVGFALVDAKPFEANYQNTGYRSLSKGFNTHEALLHRFAFSGHPPSLIEVEQGFLLNSSTADTRLSGFAGAKSYRRQVSFPAEYTVHFSFWTELTTELEAVTQSLAKTIEIYFPDLNVDIQRLVDTYVRDERTSWCFELKISCQTYALCHTYAVVRFVQLLGEKLKLQLPSAQARL